MLLSFLRIELTYKFKPIYAAAKMQKLAFYFYFYFLLRQQAQLIRAECHQFYN